MKGQGAGLSVGKRKEILCLVRFSLLRFWCKADVNVRHCTHCRRGVVTPVGIGCRPVGAGIHTDTCCSMPAGAAQRDRYSRVSVDVQDFYSLFGERWFKVRQGLYSHSLVSGGAVSQISSVNTSLPQTRSSFYFTIHRDLP